ncbi:tyrosine-protein phosphatase [Nitrospirota bacterium]
MIDIHCHILPGIDDGPKTMDESVSMARMAVEDGVTDIVATPHINFELTDPARIQTMVSELNSRLEEESISLKVHAGADVSAVIDPALVGAYTVNGSRYVLLEFPYGRIPASARATVFRFASSGLRPIITHPERNWSVISNPALVLELIESGALVQVTAGSITGEFGPESEACANRLLKDGYVHFIASDAHSPLRRKPLLSEAVGMAGKIIGEIAALALVRDNPEAVLSDSNVHVNL